jgi:YegS/Rv2252/BmrU family lipid kinase
MHTAPKSWFVIINPTSGQGSSKKSWPKIKKLLEAYNFTFNFAFTSYPKHSIRLVQEAISQNTKHIICVGGDGTIHNIVNGIMTQTKVPSYKIHVGVIPIGTGNDWVKTHNISYDFETAIKQIKKNTIVTQDIGKLVVGNNKKTPVFFNNLAGIGFDGYVVSTVEKYKHFGALAYLYGTIISLFSFKNFNATVAVESEISSGKTLMVLVGLCKYSGGGMQLTDSPNPFDGLLDISIAENFNTLDILKNLPKLFNGKIVSFKKVKTFKATSISIKINQETLPFIQADGELIGTGHIQATIIKKAFSFYC